MSRGCILIVEDDLSLAEILSYNIRQAGYEPVLARDGEDGLRQAQRLSPKLVILDLMLPLMDGLEVCRRLRADSATADLLVLMLTAKSEETDQVVGFTIGADDYVTKPFSVKVLLERMKALLRRRESREDQREIISLQGVTLDRRRHRVTLHGELLDLTPSEFGLLEVLIRQPGRAFKRNELIGGALGEKTIVLERTIDVHVRALRKKMGGAADLIETVRGVGYRFREQTSKPVPVVH